MVSCQKNNFLSIRDRFYDITKLITQSLKRESLRAPPLIWILVMFPNYNLIMQEIKYIAFLFYKKKLKAFFF